MPETIELSIGDFTAMKVDRLPSGAVHMTPVDATLFAELLDLGWQPIKFSKDRDRLTVVLERPADEKAL